ncbi:MAG TPA: hypothetical protein VK459_04975 [Polyangiaceae bacterium]|nr:hypothetical protein [Polyangiaceae bacterium]
MLQSIYVATRKGLFNLERGGDGGYRVGRASFVGDPVTMILPDGRDGSIYAAVGHGHFGAKLHRSRDGGATWEPCTNPTYPKKPDDMDDRDPMRGTPIPWNVELIWALEAGGASEPGVLWCGTIPGGLFRSRDGGASWELMESLWLHPKRKEWFGGGYDYPGIHSICVDQRNPGKVLAGVSCGGVWATEDAGATWNLRANGMFAAYMPPERRDDPSIQDPHRIVQCKGNPDGLWAQHHNGVFRSVDGAASWKEVPNVPPSTFGFAVAVHPTSPDTAWFAPAMSDEKRVPVGAKLTVARTRDGGATFESLGRGLPEDAYDIIYRHGLDVDPSGDRLAMGSTTGGLWTSDDQGDTWTALPARLPPVYSVRFVAQ